MNKKELQVGWWGMFGNAVQGLALTTFSIVLVLWGWDNGGQFMNRMIPSNIFEFLAHVFAIPIGIILFFVGFARLSWIRE